MIEFAKSYKVGNEIFATLEEAQRHEINIIAGSGLHPDVNTNKVLEAIVENIVAESDKVIDILSTTATSRPRARKAHGGTKTRTRKAPAPAVPEGNGVTVKGVVS